MEYSAYGTDGSEIVAQPVLHVTKGSAVHVVEFLTTAYEHGPGVFFVDLIELIDVRLPENIFVFVKVKPFDLFHGLVVDSVGKRFAIDFALHLFHLLQPFFALQPFVEEGLLL